ncbi:unnamed protein product [Parnassius apollo]|uniref:(apollo) hypothetical protein n=1 Tax=Parnassius apollo TaxID=110799 RepID=A0A8S3XDB5_PARAO|nr:unnamed protein product [Parnassius apollo]
MEEQTVDEVTLLNSQKRVRACIIEFGEQGFVRKQCLQSNKETQEKKNGSNLPSLNLNLHRPTTEGGDKKLKLSDLYTTVKDPIYPCANEIHLKKLVELQRFNCDDWYAVRFIDAQKKYLSTPGFVELAVNDSLKRFESAMLRDDPRSYLLERSFAGLTNSLLCQKEELQRALQALVDWAADSQQTLTPNTLFMIK